MTGIEVQGVSKRFKLKGSEVEAVTDVSFAVGKGEFVSLIGPSGCGKSTLLKMVADITQPSQGHIKVEGGSPAEARRRRLFGMVFQDPVMLPWRSLHRNVALPLELVDKQLRQEAKSPNELIELVGLSGFEAALPHQLSGGMKQRAAIARALVLRPSILLLDEPFGALDEITRQRLNIDLLRIWQESATAALLVTHSISEAVLLSDRVLVLTPRPARIGSIVQITLPRPRTLAMLRGRECFDLVSEVTEALYRPFESQATEPLPRQFDELPEGAHA